jgi:chromosome segregation ATPase
MEIKKIISDICNLDESIDNHISDISKFRDEIVVEIKSKVEELNVLEDTILAKERIRFELSNNISKLNANEGRISSKIKSLNLQVDKIKIDENKISILQDKIIKLDELLNQKITNIQITETEQAQKELEIEEIVERIEKSKLNIDQLFNTESNLKLSNIELQNKIKFNQQNIKSLDITKEEIDNKISKLNMEEDKLKSNNNYLDDLIIKKNSEIGALQDKNNKILADKSRFLEEIKELNEVKDNITHQIENERNKSRNNENRVLALKKEVLNIIMEHKNNNNKFKLAELAKEVENA